ncbi:MAG: methylated-DNA-[protein]-cysteine S-methyltransferase [Clostridia bacterium]|nr:methylated-DNA-[protein]-cysteine S-methyltransferase [Clostridia bacterium]
MKLYYDFYRSQIGTIYICLSSQGVHKVSITEEDWYKYRQKNNKLIRNTDFCREAIKEIHEYFIGKRQKFSIPLYIEGTTFQKKVWHQLQSIPYGEIRSYSQIAIAIGKPHGQRAVGQANRANPLPIFIPCHRVIGQNGSLIGYAGTKIDIQRYLLQLEGYL